MTNKDLKDAIARGLSKVGLADDTPDKALLNALAAEIQPLLRSDETYSRGVRDAVDIMLAYKLPIGPKTVTDADVINDYLDDIAKDILALAAQPSTPASEWEATILNGHPYSRHENGTVSCRFCGSLYSYETYETQFDECYHEPHCQFIAARKELAKLAAQPSTPTSRPHLLELADAWDSAAGVFEHPYMGALSRLHAQELRDAIADSPVAPLQDQQRSRK